METRQLINLRGGRPYRLLAVALVLAVPSYFVYRSAYNPSAGDAGNYEFKYKQPSHWNKLPVGPLTLFRFQLPEHEIFLQGFENQVVADINPSLNMDTDGVANFYLDRTREKMTDWKAERLEDIVSDTARFSLLRRSKEGKVVFTAFYIKGNSTFGVSLTASGRDVEIVDQHLQDLKMLLVGARFEPVVYD